MKNYLLIICIALLSACTQNKNIEEIASLNKPQLFTFANSIQPINKTEIAAETPVGYYSGMFEAEEYDEEKNFIWSNKITIHIQSLDGELIKGESIVSGNRRPFSGTVIQRNNQYIVNAIEPGDDPYDGAFQFIVEGDALTLEGTWFANDKKISVTKRNYTLVRKTFVYNPANDLPEDIRWEGLYGTWNEKNDKEEALTNDVFKFNASTHTLKGKDIENMYKGDLEVIRNAIYARHGYSFKNKKMRYLFDHFVEWYMPISIDVTNELTDLEKQNIELIKRYEDHANKYYDVFGR